LFRHAYASSVCRHGLITRRPDGSKDPSILISLTFDVLFVYWEWKRRTSYQAGQHEDASIIIVIMGPELELDKRTELGTKMLGEEHRHPRSDAFHFAQSTDDYKCEFCEFDPRESVDK
jgi:hypothetical protein